MAVVTFLIRAFPFLLFGRKNARPPELVLYLGNVIAPAAIAMLVVYCVRNVEFLGAPFGAPELIRRRSDSCCSICAGATHCFRSSAETALYMVLIRTLFA